MNKLKFLVAIVLGGLAGSGITYVAVKDKYAKFAQEDIDDVVAWAHRELGENELRLMGEIVALRTKVRELGGVVDGDLAPAFEHEEESTDVLDGGVQKTRYNAIVKTYDTQADKKDLDTVLRERGLRPEPSKVSVWDHPQEDSDDEGAEEEDEPSAPVHEPPAGPEIRVITFAEFSNDMEHYDKVTLTYYEADDTLTDDKDGIVPAPRDIVGPHALQSFDDNSEDANVVYVRNNKIGTDFEICRNFGYYTEDVLGVMPNDNPKRKKISAPLGKANTQDQEPKRNVKPRAKKAAKDGKE